MGKKQIHKRYETRYLMYLSLLTTLALVLGLVERNIPVPFMTPGAKLGLANLVTVLAIYSLPRKRDVLLVIISRLLLMSIFGGGVSALMYSTVGALLSFLIMNFIKIGLKSKVSVIGVSAAGAVFHNIGQVMVACFIVDNIGVMLYLPFLSLAGIVTGCFVGLCAQYILAYIYKLPMIKALLINKADIP